MKFKNSKYLLLIFGVFLIFITSSLISALCPTGNKPGYYETIDFSRVNGTCILKIQPNESYGKDVWISNKTGYTSTTYNNNYLLPSGWTYSGVFGVTRALFDFGVKNASEGKIISPQITNAKLSLYWRGECNTSTNECIHGMGKSTYYNTSMYLYKINAPWNEYNVNWVNKPSFTYTNGVKINAPISATSDFLNINVTTLTKEMMNDSSPGFLLTINPEIYYKSIVIGSSNDSVISRRPKLEIEYNAQLSKECYDQDSGLNYYAYGTILGFNSNGTYINSGDYCWSDGKGVMEGYCNNGLASFYSYKCPFNCLKGACIKCYDTDRGLNYYELGETTSFCSKDGCENELTTWGDYCISSKNLIEYYCDAKGTAFYAQYSCPGLCKGGVCIKATTLNRVVEYMTGWISKEK